MNLIMKIIIIVIIIIIIITIIILCALLWMISDDNRLWRWGKVPAPYSRARARGGRVKTTTLTSWKLPRRHSRSRREQHVTFTLRTQRKASKVRLKKKKSSRTRASKRADSSRAPVINNLHNERAHTRTHTRARARAGRLYRHLVPACNSAPFSPRERRQRAGGAEPRPGSVETRAAFVSPPLAGFWLFFCDFFFLVSLPR